MIITSSLYSFFPVDNSGYLTVWLLTFTFGAAYIIYKKFFAKNMVGLHKKQWQKDVVYFFQFERAPKMANYSPFCMKLELFLKANNIRYEAINNNSHRSEHGLLPFIELNGKQYADSQLIIEMLRNRFEIESHADSREQGIARAVERLVDTHTYAILFHYKFESGLTDIIISQMAFPLNALAKLFYPIVKWMIGRRIATRYPPTVGGNLKEEEFNLLLRKDLTALNDILGDRQYFLGDKIDVVDCSVFGQLASMCYYEKPNEVKRMVSEEFPNLQRYLERIIAKYFPNEFSD